MIIYFSATGNSKYCAEFLASQTNDKVILLNDMMKNNIHVLDCENCGSLGIIAPTYDMGLAYSVSEFLEGLDFQNVPENCYVYGVFTCGSVCGDCGDTLRKILAKKSLKLKAAFVVVMPDNYVLMFKQKSDAVKNDMLAKADVTLGEIADLVANKREIFKLKGKMPRFVMFLIHKFFIPSQRKVKSFKDNCACCLACLHRCPVQAINRGNSANNGRYINPNVKL